MILRSTYRQGDLSSFGHFFGEHFEKVQDAGMALDRIAERHDDRIQDILPALHMNGEDGQADAQLNPDGLGTRRKLLQED